MEQSIIGLEGAFPSWVLLVVGASFLLMGILVLSLTHDWGVRSRSNSYRFRYQKMISEFENLVGLANLLYPQVIGVKDKNLLTHFQSTLGMVETLLEAVKKISPYGTDADLLTSPQFLSKDLKLKLERIETAVSQHGKGKGHELLQSDDGQNAPVIGCHFCSRPYDAHFFSKVRVKVDGKGEEVAACHYCRERLLRVRKARVLFFNENGKQVHWSKAKSWTPSPEYWNINRDDVESGGKSANLHIVSKSVSHVSSIEGHNHSP